MVCMTCVNAAANKQPREEHCNGGKVGPNCDCQHRVPTRQELTNAREGGHDAGLRPLTSAERQVAIDPDAWTTAPLPEK